jgi:FtsX-like permease family/MacB-like periplasmic core domain
VKRIDARVAEYRWRPQLKTRWTGYLGLVVLIGLVGGLALAGVAAARATQSSFPTFLASTNPSTIDIDNGTWDPGILKQVRAFPDVKSLQTYVALNMVPIHPNGFPDFDNPFGDLEESGTLHKLFIDQDKITIVAGRMLDPDRPDEVVVNQFSADLLGFHVGEKVREGVFANDQFNADGQPTSPARQRMTLTVVGIGIFNDEVVQDDVDRITRMVVSPALADKLAGCCGSYAWSGVQLKDGAAGVQPFLNRYFSKLPSSSLPYIHVTSVIEEQAEQAVKPESLALGVFGLIAGMATLIIAAQSIGRQVRLSTIDRQVLRSLGADPADTILDGLPGIAVSIVLGALLAAGVSLLLSPLAPFGPVRQVEPVHRISFDWTVLCFGTAALLIALLGLAWLFSVRDAPHRVALRMRRTPERSSGVVAALASSGLSVPATTGVRYALDAGRGRTAVPVRSAIIGTVLAVVVVVASLTFGSSLRTLISHPALYGWNWNYIFESDAGYGDMPAAAGSRLLDQDHDVIGWTGGYYTLLTIDGQSVPVLGESPGGTVQPSTLDGRGLEARNQVVLGSETLRNLHKQIGDTVTTGTGAQRVTLTIVGTATMPTVGVGHGLHLSMGTGALLDAQYIPALQRNIQQFGSVGPNVYFIRTRPGITAAAAARSLEKVGNGISNAAGQPSSVQLFGVQHPAQIVNYRSMGSTPTLLAGALAVGAFGALGLTLGASVRRRRRDLAVLKTLGFTRRQLAETVAWQASISVAIGTVVGIPVGIALGRFLWTLFARELYAVPHPTVSVVSVIGVAFGALVLANLVAAVPAMRAARTPTALVLRSE